MVPYHHPGYAPLPGAQPRYQVTYKLRVLTVVGFGASLGRAATRDRFIGWIVCSTRSAPYTGR